MESISYQGFPDCFRLRNDEVEVVVSTSFGPRILKYSLIDGENILGEHFAAAVTTSLGEWKPYGGHRLWIAPEHMPNSYTPDNSPIAFEIGRNDLAIHLIQPLETVTRTQKELTVTLEKEGSSVELIHKITNHGNNAVRFSAWALTIMRGGGVCEIPNEVFEPYGPETLLPVRNLTCWSYTDFSDSRWQFDRDFIRFRVDETRHEPQKIGVLNKQGWAAYTWQNLRFTKSFPFLEGAEYPDLNSNMEIYSAGGFVEVESLSPLQTLAPQESLTHTETWKLEKIS